MIDVSTSLPNLGSQGSSFSPAAKVADVPVSKTSQVVKEPVQIPAIEQKDIRAFEEKRFNRVVEAAKNYSSDFFAISDTRFTIFKDGSGQYITRFTNLRDGSVTYLPEPDVLRFMERRTAERRAAYEMNA